MPAERLDAFVVEAQVVDVASMASPTGTAWVPEVVFAAESQPQFVSAGLTERGSDIAAWWEVLVNSQGERLYILAVAWPDPVSGHAAWYINPAVVPQPNRAKLRAATVLLLVPVDGLTPQPDGSGSRYDLTDPRLREPAHMLAGAIQVSVPETLQSILDRLR